MTTVDIVKAAAATLDEALALDWPELVVSDRAKLWLLGQVWGESRFGSTPDWGTSNNWGAVTYYKKDGKYLEHADHDAAAGGGTAGVQGRHGRVAGQRHAHARRDHGDPDGGDLPLLAGSGSGRTQQPVRVRGAGGDGRELDE